MIQGCYDGGGNVKVVAALPCPKGYTPFSWNQQGIQGIPGTNGTSGTDGEDGVSVTSSALSPGDANCQEGGSQFTAANGDMYACNGTPGADGLNGVDGQDGAQGRPGERGPQGEQGIQGPPGLVGYERTSAFVQIAPGLGGSFETPCPTGKQVLGGGYAPFASGLEVDASYPGPGEWVLQARNTSSATLTVTIYVVCASVGT